MKDTYINEVINSETKILVVQYFHDSDSSLNKEGDDNDSENSAESQQTNNDSTAVANKTDQESAEDKQTQQEEENLEVN